MTADSSHSSTTEPPVPWAKPLIVGVITVTAAWTGFVASMFPPGWQRTAAVAEPVAAETQELLALGKQRYLLCASCHGTDGQGIAGLAPKLAGSRWVLGEPEALAHIVMDGLAWRHDSEYAGAMVGWGQRSDREIAAVMTYVRSQWGNDASPVPVEVVAAVRKASRQRQRPWTFGELEVWLMARATEGREREEGDGDVTGNDEDESVPVNDRSAVQ